MTAPTLYERMAILRAKKAANRATQTIDDSDTLLAENTPQASEKAAFCSSLEDAEWVRMAAEKGLRLPTQRRACTSRSMMMWLEKLGLSLQWFQDWSGIRSPSQWMAYNPDKGLRWFAGLLLEEVSA